MKRTTILANGSQTVLEGSPSEMAAYDRELMKQMVALLHDEDDDTDEEPTKKEADETN